MEALWLLSLFILPAFFAPWMAFLHKRIGYRVSWLAAAVAAVGFGTILTLPVGTSVSVPWMPHVGIQFALLMDDFSRIVALLISGIGSMIFLSTPAAIPEPTPDWGGCLVG